MATYKLVDPRDIERLMKLADEVRQLASTVLDGPELSMTLPGGQPAKPVPEPSKNGTTVAGPAKKYRIAKGAWKYADVVDREVESNVFSLDEAWDTLEPLVETNANRPRDGLRVGLDRDDRFRRIDGPGVRWRRVDPTQEEIAIDE